MQYIFIYSLFYNFKSITIHDCELILKILRENSDTYEVETVKGNYKINIVNKRFMPYLQNENNIDITEDEEQKIITGGFIYDDEIQYEERKKLLKLDVSRIMKNEINTIINKQLDEVKKLFNNKE